MRWKISTLGARDQTGKSLAFCRPSRPGHCRRGVRAAKLAAHSKNKPVRSARKMRRADETTGDKVNLISYLPATVATLFVLAAGLLLGYIQ